MIIDDAITSEASVLELNRQGCIPVKQSPAPSQRVLDSTRRRGLHDRLDPVTQAIIDLISIMIDSRLVDRAVCSREGEDTGPEG